MKSYGNNRNANVPTVSMLAPVRNEEMFLSEVLDRVVAQGYPKEKMEVFIIDGRSDDRTKQIVNGYTARYPYFKLLDNPGKIVSTGLNQAIKESKGEIVVRLDGHTLIEPDYVQKCVKELKDESIWNVGGKMSPVGKSLKGQAIAFTMSSRFGVGNSKFHYLNKRTFVETVYLGAWRRSIFKKIGLFDESLTRNQDDEFNHRIMRAGGKILLSPDIKSKYFVRENWKSLFTQYFQYGFWKLNVMIKHPSSIRVRHLVPSLFCALTFVGFFSLLLFQTGFIFLGIFCGSYAFFCLTASAFCAFKSNLRLFPYLVTSYVILHVAYGLGLLGACFAQLKRIFLMKLEGMTQQ